MKIKRVFCFVISIFLIFQFAYSKPKDNSEQDLSLFEIDRLIRQTEYDEALKQLKNYIEKNPLKFDLAQTRIKKIMNARRDYSLLAQRLISLIQTDPSNSKEIYEITSQLEQFEKNPSDENLQFIADLKKSAEFNYFRALFMEIQEASAQLTKSGMFVEGANKAKEGFWLYKEEFYETWKDSPELLARVDLALAKIDETLELFAESSFQKKMADAVESFEKSVNNENYADSLNKFSNCVSLFNELNTQIKSFEDANNQLFAAFEETKKVQPDVTDASFIPFVTRFVSGVASVENSGILGALKGEWEHNINKMAVAVEKNVKDNYSKYQNSLKQKLFENKSYISDNQVKKSKTIIQNDNDLITKILNLDSVVFEDSKIQVFADKINYLALINQKVFEITEASTKINKDEKFKNPNEVIDIISQVYAVIGTKSSWEILLPTPEEWKNITDKYNWYVSELFSVSQQVCLRGWAALDEYYVSKNNDLYLQIQNKNQVAKFFDDGLINPVTFEVQSVYTKDPNKVYKDYKKLSSEKSLQDSIHFYYPDICISLGNNILESINTIQSFLENDKNNLLEDFNKNAELNSTEEIQNTMNQILLTFEKTKENLVAESDFAKKIIDKNKQRSVQSQLAVNEADLRFSEAKSALDNEQFDIARRRLQDSLTKYDEALNLQNNSKLRAECDEKLMNLGNEITKRENQIVVVEVRQLKNQARDAYFNGRFEDAEKLLTQAQSRWAVTNVEEDEEIVSLMNYVNTAISMQTGREIAATDPLYPEMSQLLNIAYQYYDQGSAKIASGDKVGGLDSLDKALETLQRLQYVFPINQEASLLTLKINKLKEPQKFASEFDQKIKIARELCKNKSTQQEGYANLLDYLALEPNYKGLKDLVYQVEIDIGIRQKKVAKTEVNRAQNYVKDAQVLFNKAGNDEDKLKKALDKINQAIKLNPDNKEAMALKDKITTKIGGNTITVLSTEDERIYQLAVKKLQENDIIGANALAMQLLKKKQNGSLKKIKDLKNKIDARL